MSQINLVKGQKINLAKSDGSSLTKFCAGANWGVLPSGEAVDLDLYAATIDSNWNTLEIIGFGEKWSSRNGAILHSGDDLVGDEDGDDGLDNEIVTVDLSRLDAGVEKIVLFLTSFRGHDFAIVPHASVRIYEGTNEHVTNVIARYDIGREPSFSGSVVMVMGMFYRYKGAWKFNAIGVPTSDTNYRCAMESIKRMFV
jgi:tellurium resistance protein TerZ